MTDFASDSNIPLRSRAEATRWRVQLAEAGLETSVEFENWISSSPDNSAAWAWVSDAWTCFDVHATAPEIMKMRAATLSRAQSRMSRRFFESAGGRMATAAAILFFVFGGLMLTQLWFSLPEVYRTERGERLVVSLADGSQLTLDADTEVKVKLGDTERRLELTKGQARFVVAHDKKKPFYVLADGRKVVAVGTAFDIHMWSTSLFVTLIKGEVLVMPSECCKSKAGKNEQPISLMMGQQLELASNGHTTVSNVSIDRASDWERGEITFTNVTLSEAVDRINRYSTVPIVIADMDAKGLRLSGVFRTDDMKGFFEMLSQYLGCVAVEEKGRIAIYSRR